MAKSDFSDWKKSTSLLKSRIDSAAESALDAQAEILLRASKKQVPKKSRALMRSAKSEDGAINTKIKKTRRVSYNEPYAAYQHEGQRADGSHVVKNYTTSGTKKLYLKDPLDKNKNKFIAVAVKAFKKFGF